MVVHTKVSRSIQTLHIRTGLWMRAFRTLITASFLHNLRAAVFFSGFERVPWWRNRISSLHLWEMLQPYSSSSNQTLCQSASLFLYVFLSICLCLSPYVSLLLPSWFQVGDEPGFVSFYRESLWILQTSKIAKSPGSWWWIGVSCWGEMSGTDWDWGLVPFMWGKVKKKLKKTVWKSFGTPLPYMKPNIML